MSTVPTTEPATPAGGEQPDPGAMIGLTPQAAEAPLTPVGADNQPAEQPAQPAAPAPEPEQPWPAEIAARYPQLVSKFKDPAALAESYTNFERLSTVLQQAGLTPEEALEAIRDLRQTAPAEEEEIVEPQPPAPPSAEEVSQALDQFAGDPFGTIDQRVERGIARWMRFQSQAQEMWDEAETRIPNLKQHQKAMQKVLAEMPELVRRPDVIDIVYSIATGRLAAAPAAAASPPAPAGPSASEVRAQVMNQVANTFAERGTGGASPGTAMPSGAQKIADDILGAPGPNPQALLRKI